MLVIRRALSFFLLLTVVAILCGATPPSIYIDSIATGTAVPGSGTTTVAGWAIDNTTSIGTGIGSVQILVDGVVIGTASYGTNRPDVCAVYPGRSGCPNVGFTYQLNTGSLSRGTHTITALATDTDSAPDSSSYSISLTVLAGQPLPVVYID